MFPDVFPHLSTTSLASRILTRDGGSFRLILKELKILPLMIPHGSKYNCHTIMESKITRCRTVYTKVPFINTSPVVEKLVFCVMVFAGTGKPFLFPP